MIVALSLVNRKRAIPENPHEVLVHVARSKKIRPDLKERNRIFDGLFVTGAQAFACSIHSAGKREVVMTLSTVDSCRSNEIKNSIAAIENLIEHYSADGYLEFLPS